MHQKKDFEKKAAFERMSKRRRGFPSEACVKRGFRIVHGDKELTEKLGRNDDARVAAGGRFKKCCMRADASTASVVTTTNADDADPMMSAGPVGDPCPGPGSSRGGRTNYGTPVVLQYR